MTRCILFAEVPGFYASIARADDPSLALRPVIVGGDPRKRGRVQSATPDALSTGVTLDMAVLEALRLCPQARAVRTDMARYREVSRRLFTALRQAAPRLETFGLGACYADAGNRAEEAQSIAERWISSVEEALGLPLRVGIGPGKFLARLAASEVAEASGVLRLPPGREAERVANLPAERLDGVGRKTAAALASLGAHTIGEVVMLGRERLQQEFGSHGLRIHACAAGEDSEPIRAERHAKSLSRESTLREEAHDVGVFAEMLGGLAQELEQELARMGLAAGRVAVKARFAEGVTTRSATLPGPTASARELREAALGLLERTQAGARPLRGLGIQLSLLTPASEADRQLQLFRS